MKNPIVRWLSVLNILILCGLSVFLVSRFHQKQHQQENKRAEADALVREVEKNDKTPQAETMQLQAISDEIGANRPITDNQFAFLLTELNKPCPQGYGTVSHLFATTTLNHVEQPLSPTRKAILYQELTPVLAQPDLTASSGITMTQMRELEACDLLAKFDVREATPQILPLLNDPKPQIRNDAKRALKKLGYNV